jgi:hypothetical protein
MSDGSDGYRPPLLCDDADHVRLSLRPRRTVSLDRQVSLLPFLRPIEEEDTSTCSRLTPAEQWCGGSASTSSSTSSLSTSSDEEQLMAGERLHGDTGSPSTIAMAGERLHGDTGSPSTMARPAGKQKKRDRLKPTVAKHSTDETCMDSDDDCIFKGKGMSERNFTFYLYIHQTSKER